jgi:hypothetical protein
MQLLISIWGKILLNAEDLYDKLANQGFFWSYDKSAGYPGDDLLTEHTLLYGEVEDISALFDIFKKEKIIDVWHRRIVPDERFYGLNYYLAVIWFDIDEPEKYLKEVSKKHSRYEKLKSLI